MKFSIVLLLGLVSGSVALETNTDPNGPMIWGQCVVKESECRFQYYVRNGFRDRGGQKVQRWDITRTSRVCGPAKKKRCPKDGAPCSIAYDLKKHGLSNRLACQQKDSGVLKFY
ncbi:unnamed protein product [Clonostachys solani]|uniref:Uncharacterized protein n=1 Tax=Clonostachys solani TaxID=160281 RepID=A0A9N9W8Z7_9HYPO|nr:unnamed protein product [Clonostachys solani]